MTDQSMTLVWEDPPFLAERREWGEWRKTLIPLADHPGQWARIAEGPSSAVMSRRAASLKKGALGRRGSGASAVPAGKWEFRSGRIPNSDPPRFGVWAKYVGPE